MANLVIQSQSGKDVTTSLIVAEVFGKEHSKVVRDIENLSCSESFNTANFGVIAYIDSRGREQKAYEMTKDGFSFLVMGYTGAKAGQFKEAFINEFNKREIMLNSDDYILARSQEILQKRLQSAEQRIQVLEGANELKEEQIKLLAPKAEYTDAVLQSTTTYTFTQIAKDCEMTGATTLANFLISKRVIYRQSGQYMPTAKYSKSGYFKNRTHTYENSRGEKGTNTILVVTEAGRQFIHNLISKNA